MDADLVARPLLGSVVSLPHITASRVSLLHCMMLAVFAFDGFIIFGSRSAVVDGSVIAYAVCFD